MSMVGTIETCRPLPLRLTHGLNRDTCVLTCLGHDCEISVQRSTRNVERFATLDQSLHNWSVEREQFA
jgi:hypothetical protein